MPSERLEIKLSLNKLLLYLVVTVVPICVVGLYTITRAEQAMDRSIGNHFHTIAATTASEVAQFINDRVVAVGTLAVSPILTEAVSEANRAYEGISDEMMKSRILRMEKEWNTPASEPFVKQMLGSRASRLLNRYREIDRRFLRITLTDSHGAAIAATHKTLDYFQGDEDFWQATYAEGRGAIHLTDVLYDEVTKSHYIGLGVPIMEEGTNRFIGALDALIEVSTIFPLIHRIETGDTMRAALVKQDGTIIYSPGATLAMNLKSEEYSVTEPARQTPEGRQRGYMTTTLRNGTDVLIGFADTGLAPSFPNLAWMVLVTQDANEAFSATRGVLRLILFSAAVALAMVTLLAVFFSLHRRPDYTDIGAARETSKGSPTDTEARA